jgi:hypothetical protein
VPIRELQVWSDSAGACGCVINPVSCHVDAADTASLPQCRAVLGRPARGPSSSSSSSSNNNGLCQRIAHMRQDVLCPAHFAKCTVPLSAAVAGWCGRVCCVFTAHAAALASLCHRQCGQSATALALAKVLWAAQLHSGNLLIVSLTLPMHLCMVK